MATFQSCGPVLRDMTLQRFAGSPRYRDLVNSFDALLLLADRIVRACEGHPDLGRAAEITESLSGMSQGNDCDADRLLDAVELWLKAVLRLALPDQYAARKTKDGEAERQGKSRRGFNLFACMEDLGLASTAELNTPGSEIERVGDGVVRAIWYAKFDRNNATHETSLSDFELRGRQKTGACVAILAPLHLHKRQIRESLRSLVTRAPDFGLSTNVNKIVDSERRVHLNRFKGRADDLRGVHDALEACRGVGYVLITAEEGTGKSALCAKLSEEVNAVSLRASGQAWGASAASVTSQMSWLPGAIVHFGKSGRDARTIAAFLLAQINSMTLEKFAGVGDALGLQSLANTDDEERRRERLVERSFPHAKDARPEADHAGMSSARPLEYGEQLRRSVYAGLDALAKERGDVVLIIDALEEISEDPSGFSFLPFGLPPGVAALITSRRNTPAVRWAEDTLHIAQRISLQYLKRQDISEMSRVPDDTPDRRAFNDKLFSASGGLPLQIQRILDGIDITQPNLARVELERGTKQLHAKQVAAWVKLGVFGKQSLLALALFEPVAPLSLETLQRYLTLARIGEVPDLSDLRDLLQPVANQTQGFDERFVKLANRPFAAYVREEHFSKTDLLQPLSWLRTAIVADSDVAATQLAAFIEYWGNESRYSDHRRIAEGVLDDLRERRDAKRLAAIADECRVWENAGNENGLRALRLAAELEYPSALRTLGLMTIDGKGTPPDPIEGRRLLGMAITMGDRRATVFLGNRLIDGRGLPKSPVEGVALLETAIASDVPEAVFAMGTRLVFGDGIERDSRRGSALLEQAAEAGDHRAMWVVGTLLFSDQFIQKDPARGELWLTRAAEAGHEAAMVQLGMRLLDGDDVILDTAAGKRWLEEACQQGSTVAMTILALRLFDGACLAKDPAAAQQLLVRAAEAGDEEAMRFLAARLIEGDGVPQDPQAGLVWLEKAASSGDEIAVDRLDREHIRRLAIANDRSKSEKWLRQAFALRSPDKASVLGFELYGAGEKELAALAFRQSFKGGHLEVGNNLFYMLRRNEVRAEPSDGPPHKLVDALVERPYYFAVVNKSLALAAGFECDIDWKAADGWMQRLLLDEKERKDIIEWWHALAKRGEGEGHLVLGWLLRHAMIEDPESFTTTQRFDEAKRLGWIVPDWLLAPLPT